MDCSRVKVSGHALRRAFARALSQADIVAVIRTGAIIESYPNDVPFPGYLMLGFVAAGPLHVVVAKDDASGDCIIVTAYVPDPAQWTPDFRRRLP